MLIFEIQDYVKLVLGERLICGKAFTVAELSTSAVNLLVNFLNVFLVFEPGFYFLMDSNCVGFLLICCAPSKLFHNFKTHTLFENWHAFNISVLTLSN